MGGSKRGQQQKRQERGCLVSAFGQTTFSALSPLKDQVKRRSFQEVYIYMELG